MAAQGGSLVIAGNVKRLKPLPPPEVNATPPTPPAKSHHQESPVTSPSTRPGAWISPKKTSAFFGLPQEVPAAAADTVAATPPAAVVHTPKRPVAAEKKKNDETEEEEKREAAHAEGRKKLTKRKYAILRGQEAKKKEEGDALFYSDQAADIEDDIEEVDEFAERQKAKETACAFCMQSPATTPACVDCKKSFCVDCQTEHPLECLGDINPSKKAWQCFGCLNAKDATTPAATVATETTAASSSKKQSKRNEDDDYEILIDETSRKAKEFEEELLDFVPFTRKERPCDPPTGPTSTSLSSSRSGINIMLVLPEPMSTLTRPSRVRTQLPLCLKCLENGSHTANTIRTAVGVASPCGHAIVCSECADEFFLAKTTRKCLLPKCNRLISSVVVIQNAVEPPIPAAPLAEGKKMES